ncbi:hypothetical protein OHA77_17390 [Streptosporangium sp. NBC_01639]|uniref:hypothetical protein n=1 Tax=unclassified Streptosporangium TaxID=2632669 RepID=UPI002DDC1405|nr:hypothetical protein [Streptosporangium sp. NBC_01756]WSC83189.1 hypothetical protein OIE48_22500 [Streptosporangium sp. NBC_01756]WTD58231.1 hypothetical protein OHA77_17390 [Streptosporangium sp. NBC_01639]
MCEQHAARRRDRRAQSTRDHDYARAGRPAPRGWFAHRCGVSRCGQIFVPARLAQQESMWRGQGDE